MGTPGHSCALRYLYSTTLLTAAASSVPSVLVETSYTAWSSVSGSFASSVQDSTLSESTALWTSLISSSSSALSAIFIRAAAQEVDGHVSSFLEGHLGCQHGRRQRWVRRLHELQLRLQHGDDKNSLFGAVWLAANSSEMVS
ncbi:hypothetical protein PR003_g32589 [Phytophthora rubi]|uniref:RxLR effector protein n=1 Tax=Phytophthora rubi TaxID=129364 RepID=A0A6A3GI39_9STRA|nr:hypothetical protein PR002_g31302 [Phytophthora rubi]KAE9265020.1 hypothetical protein PR003_g32589 [Phytophthora rubi]